MYSPSPPAFVTAMANSAFANPYMGALQMNGEDTLGNQVFISFVVGAMTDSLMGRKGMVKTSERVLSWPTCRDLVLTRVTVPRK